MKLNAYEEQRQIMQAEAKRHMVQDLIIPLGAIAGLFLLLKMMKKA